MEWFCGHSMTYWQIAAVGDPGIARRTSWPADRFSNTLAIPTMTHGVMQVIGTYGRAGRLSIIVQRHHAMADPWKRSSVSRRGEPAGLRHQPDTGGRRRRAGNEPRSWGIWQAAAARARAERRRCNDPVSRWAHRGHLDCRLPVLRKRRRARERGGIRSLLHAHLSDKRGAEIGRFGLGFKSVLGVTDKPEFYSRPVSFGFDAAWSREQISQVAPGRERYPTLRVARVIDLEDACAVRSVACRADGARDDDRGPAPAQYLRVFMAQQRHQGLRPGVHALLAACG